MQASQRWLSAKWLVPDNFLVMWKLISPEFMVVAESVRCPTTLSLRERSATVFANVMSVRRRLALICWTHMCGSRKRQSDMQFDVDLRSVRC
jgi:hypothetical protein